MGVIGGAIEGIDTPLQAALFGDATALLSQHSDLRCLLRQQAQHRRFCSQVGLGDQITTAPLLSHLLQPPEVMAQQLTSSQGGPAGQVGQLLQVWALQA